MKIDFRTKVAAEAVAQGKLEPTRARHLERVLAKGLEAATQRGSFPSATSYRVVSQTRAYGKLTGLERNLVFAMYQETLKNLAKAFSGAAAKRIEFLADGVPRGVAERFEAVAKRLEEALPTLPALAGKIERVGSTAYNLNRDSHDLPALTVNLSSPVDDATREDIRGRVAAWLKSNRYNSIIAGRPLADAIWVRNPIKEI